jgi:hypothetical protein
MKKLFSLVVCFLFLLCAHAKEWQSTVAVVVDEYTYMMAGKEIDRYLVSIRQSGKQAVLIQDVWQHPDSIRVRLKALYLSDNLEGAVFIGDIPVPMIRDAQHLATAFKMDQSRDWKQSSIPSDRFYDDFDLQFDYIRQDEDIKLYHYYSLRHTSTQSLSSDIYSARIRPPVVPGKDKYELIADYLKKAVQEKQTQRELSQILYFAGHGYNSESINARVDEGWALKRHFPFLGNRRGSKLDFINYDADQFVKFRLLAKLADPELDIALLHHHGADDTQYLNGMPHTSNPQQYIEYTQQFFRGKIRSAKDTIASKKYYLGQYDVPESWTEHAFDPKIAAADSIFNASMDINIPDTYKRVFNAKFIVFDACFNGSFHLDDYISAHYLFNTGGAIVAKANTVNILQDTWPNRFIGLLDEGVCVGNWAKEVFTLESHLIGDPTFHFAVSKDKHLDRDLVKERNNANYWRKLRAQANKPDVKTLALLFLQKNKAITSDELLAILTDDPDPIVRLEAFTLLKKSLSPQLSQAIILALNDSYELLRRLAALTAGKSGDPALLHTIVQHYFDPATPSRIIFQLRYAIDQYPYETIAASFAAWRKEHPYWPTEGAYDTYLKSVKRSAESKKADADKLGDPEETAKSKRFTISTQKNLCQATHLDQFFAFLTSSDDQYLRLLLAETFGWYVYSHRRDEIAAFCTRQLAVEQDTAVKNELQKTINRLYGN